MRWVVLLLLLPFAAHADGSRDFDYGSFSRIPILHEGRIKPLDSFARVTLKQIYGKASLPDMSATEWLAGALFAPTDAAQQKIFAVRLPEVIPMLALPPRTDGVYSFEELAGVLAVHQTYMATLMGKDRKTLLPAEQELVRLYGNVNDVAEIITSLSLLSPMPDVDEQMRGQLGVPDEDEVTYVDLLKIRHEISSALADTVKHKKDRIREYTLHERYLAEISYRMHLLEEMSRNNTLLRVIPPFWEGTEEWLSPWMVIKKGVGSPASAELFHHWQDLAVAYGEPDALLWKQASKKLLTLDSQAKDVRPFALSLEVVYNALSPLNKSLIGYMLAVTVALAGIVLRKTIFLSLAYMLMLASALLHAIAIAARMAILMRPPVSTLYESMIFVSLVTVGFGLFIERKRRSGDGLIISALVASLLLVTANVFAGDSDTLEVLVAVLNTNFWLATHVVCITTGYGSSLIAGMLAHLYLVRRALGTGRIDALATLQRSMHSVALIALLFTAVGTMLGGIWADQSWGRFWGWDPKENGALWIVLWLVWLLHGRVGGQITELGFATGMALINVVVALAWVGVNLLSVGLHSYGFTDTAATSLIAFCAFEFGFVAFATWLIFYRERRAHGL